MDFTMWDKLRDDYQALLRVAMAADRFMQVYTGNGPVIDELREALKEVEHLRETEDFTQRSAQDQNQ